MSATQPRSKGRHPEGQEDRQHTPAVEEDQDGSLPACSALRPEVQRQAVFAVDVGTAAHECRQDPGVVARRAGERDQLRRRVHTVA